jgi:ribose/xylose/arabinose/galactoside ABC-type transport system permease subunit
MSKHPTSAGVRMSVDSATSGRAAARLVALLRNYGIHLALLALIVVFSFASPYFATAANLINILNQVAVVGIVAIGMTFVILTAGIDLSVGSMLALASLVSAAMSVESNHGILTWVLAFVSPFIVGAVAGGLNGALVATGRIAPFVVTLATLVAYRGLAVWYHVNPIYGLPGWYRTLGADRLAGVPYGVITYALVIIIASVTINRTRFGREVYAVGGNEHASRVSGINVRRIKFSVYVISGLCVGLAALIHNGRTGAGQSYVGEGMELQAIAAVVIGGVSLFGGRGSISNAVVGTLVMGVLFNGLVLLNVPSPIQNVVIGAILVGAVLFDGVVRNRRS